MTGYRLWSCAAVVSAFVLVLVVRLPELLWWLLTAGVPLLAIGLVLGGVAGRHQRDRQSARAQDVAALERAEAVLTALDDEPPPLPPAIPMEMRDPAFQRRDAELEQADSSETHYLSRKSGGHGLITSAELRKRLLAQPLIADRSFTLTTHCPHGHVATHWLGRTTTDHVERICRFERCAATWKEHR